MFARFSFNKFQTFGGHFLLKNLDLLLDPLSVHLKSWNNTALLVCTKWTLWLHIKTGTGAAPKDQQHKPPLKRAYIEKAHLLLAKLNLATESELKRLGILCIKKRKIQMFVYFSIISQQNLLNHKGHRRSRKICVRTIMWSTQRQFIAFEICNNSKCGLSVDENKMLASPIYDFFFHLISLKRK